jgi:hypothetical protein
LREQVEMLRVELEEAHAANRENRRIIAALTQRVPALEPPGAPESAVEEPEREEPRSGTGGYEESAQRPPDTGEWPVSGGSLTRPWWRRVLVGRRRSFHA